MGAVNSNSEVIQDILKTLGLEGKKVISLNIDATVGRPVIVTVERYLDEKEALEMKHSLQMYNLKLVNEKDKEEE